MTSMAATSTPVHHHHTYITSIRHGNMTKGRGGGSRHDASRAPGMFSFFYITTTYLAWNEPMNGQNKTEMGRAQDVMRLEPLVCFFVSLLIVFLKLLILFSQIELANRYGRAKMRWKWIWLGTRVAKCLKPQVHFYIY